MLSKPEFNYLSQEGIEKIHQTGIYILNNFGIKVEDPEVRTLFQEHGCTVDGDRVKISSELIEKTLNNLSDRIKLSGREGKEVVLEPGKFATHSTGGIPFYIDPRTGKKRDAVLKDLIESIYLMNQMDELDVPCAFMCPSDIPNDINQLRQCEHMFRYSNKPIYGPGISSPKEAKYIVEIFKACGDGPIKDNPRGLVGVSPESPLYIPKDISYILKTVIEAGIPVSILAAPIAGVSSPYTIAGSMAQVHAEIISMAVLAYIYNPATPVMYGSRVCFANMKTGNSIWGIPELGICSSIASKLARRTGFITDVYGTATSSCTLDSQSGFERSMNSLLPILSGAEFISGFGSLASVMIASLEQLVLDNEYYAMLRKITKGVTIGDEEIGLDVIENVVNGSQFIQEMHTVKYLRSGEIFTPKLGFQGIYSEWENGGCKTIADVASEKVLKILDEDINEVLDPEQSKELDNIISSASKELLK